MPETECRDMVVWEPETSAEEWSTSGSGGSTGYGGYGGWNSSSGSSSGSGRESDDDRIANRLSKSSFDLFLESSLNLDDCKKSLKNDCLMTIDMVSDNLEKNLSISEEQAVIDGAESQGQEADVKST